MTKCWGTVEWWGIYLALERPWVLGCVLSTKQDNKKLKSKQNLRSDKLCDLKRLETLGSDGACL